MVEAEARSVSERRALGYEDQGALLRDLAAGRQFPQVLDGLVRGLEAQAPGLIASIMLVDDKRLRVAAAPNLPDGYNRAADNHPIGEGFGSCGTAAHRAQPVLVDNIDGDPLWKNYRDIARRYRLAACWSVPIQGTSGEVLGTFALYCHEPRRPRPDEVELMRGFADLAAFAIHHHHMSVALHERESELGALVDDLGGLAWRTDGGEARTFSVVSPGAERLLGVAAARFTDEPGLWESLIHPEDREATLRWHRQVARDPADGESIYRLVGASGRAVWMRDVVHVRPGAAGAPPQLRGVMVNVSRQREAEQEREDLLRRQLDPDSVERKSVEESLRLLADAGAELGTRLEPGATARALAELATRTLADWCVVVTQTRTDGVGAAAFAHRDPARAALGAELEQLLPQPGGVPFGASAVLATGESRLLPEIPFDAFEPGAARPELMRLVRGLGAESAMVAPLFAQGRDEAPSGSGGGEVLGALICVSCSPARRYGERDLRVAEELGRRAGLALANARLYHEAQAAIRHREEFLSIAAHELRTPLATLQLTTQALLMMIDTEPMQLDYVRARAQAGERQSLRLSRLINDLLDVSAIKAGHMRIQKEKMDLVDAVQAVCGRMRHELLRKGIDVAVHAPRPVMGRWDPDRIEQIVTNLVSNAIKYGERRPVRVTVRAEGTMAVLAVEDQGIGMTSEVRARLFQAFERGLSVTHYGGLGLGLYITSKIVHAHGGNISVRSTPGEGSTFTVQLPAHHEPEPRQEHEDDPHSG